MAAEGGWPAPSYSVVHRIVAGLDRGLVSLAQHSDAGYRDEFDLVLRRESAHPNDLWQADHTELDLMILDEAGRPVRPWLTVILDDRSRRILLEPRIELGLMSVEHGPNGRRGLRGCGGGSQLFLGGFVGWCGRCL